MPLKTNVLKEPEAAQYLGLSVSFLRKSRLQGGQYEGPPWVKQGRRVVYLIADLDEWLACNRVTPTRSG